MKKKLQIFGLLIFIGLSYFMITSNQYEQFYPIVYKVEYDGLVIDDINISESFYENLEKVLIHYNIDYKWKDEVIHVKKTTYKDMDTCWNYTSKATNKVWLNSR